MIKLDENSVGTMDEIRKLREQLADRDQQLKDIGNTYKTQLKLLQDENDKIQRALSGANLKIQELQYIRHKTESDIASLQSRLQADDLEYVAEVASVDDYDYISLCEVLPVDYKGNSNMERLADVRKDGTLVPFYVNEEQPKQFENRNRLFYRNGPTEPGSIGFWKWRAIPNNTDPTRDFIESEFIPDVNPIEIITTHDCETEEELLERIKNGINIELLTPRALFSVYLSKGQYVGFLCRSRDFRQIGTTIKLSDTVMSLPRYEFSIQDTVRVLNEKVFYRSINIGMPFEIINVKNPFDIVKTVIVSRNSWQIFKQTGKTRSEWKNMRNLLENMDTTSVIDDIVHAANCTYIEAQKMLDEFIKYAGQYIDGSSIEDNIIEAVMAAKPDLMKRCKDLIMEEWISDNLTAIEDAENTINSLKKQIEDTKEELEKEKQEEKAIFLKQKDEAEKELSSIRAERDSLAISLQKIKDSISDHEILAKDVEAEVEKRIRRAQTNAAEFIADLAFVPQTIAKQNESVLDDGVSQYTAGLDLFAEEPEECYSWNSTLDIISDEFQEAGVLAEYALPLAAYIYAAYLCHYPLIIFGPNSGAIVDAFSGAVFGRTAGILECKPNFSRSSVSECFNSNDKVIKIMNPFSSDWVNRIPEIVSNSDKFFIATHPYSEDTLIEPKSLYSYFLPIFTEVFIEKSPSGSIIGGKIGENYKEFQIVEGARSHGKILTEMHAPLLVRNRIQSLVANMHKMLNNQNEDYDVLFALLPYAFATMQMPLLMDAIKSEEKKKLSISKSILDVVNGMYNGNE